VDSAGITLFVIVERQGSSIFGSKNFISSTKPVSKYRKGM
jgi:hypothetical protein